mgnify:CR=1 FL=1
MAKLVAKEYANWDSSDTAFPFLRVFDIWEGHSWAAGFSSGNSIKVLKRYANTAEDIDESSLDEPETDA